MNLLAIARHGIGIAGPPPLGLAVARALAIDFVAAADREAVTVQAAGPDGEAKWLSRLPVEVRRVPLPPGITFAFLVSNGVRVVASLLVAERERDLGDRPGVVLRIGLGSIELDRRDGSPTATVMPRLVGLAQARAVARLAAVSP